MLAKILAAAAKLRSQGATDAQIGQILGPIIHSPLLAAAVAATPTPLDDLALGALKALFPAA
jgi:hypothetical protein